MAELDEMRLYRLAEVSEILHVPHSSLKQWAQNGMVSARKLGTQWRMTAQDIRDLRDNGTREPAGARPMDDRDAEDAGGLKRSRKS